MLTAYSRVTVVTSGRHIDLALPNALPLSDVLPQVMRYVDTGDREAGDAPVAWTLARLGGTALGLSQTLSESGVLDGDVLELRAQTQDVRPAMIEDVRDAVEDSVDAAGGVWSTRTTGAFTVQAGSTALTVLAAVAIMRGTAEPVAAGIVALIALGASWWAAQFARAVDAQVAAAVAMLWAGLSGASIGIVPAGWPVVLVAAASALVAAGVSRALTVTTTGHVAFAAVLLVAALGEVLAGVTSIPAAQERRVIPVLAILVIGVLPRVSLSVGGLASADYRVRHVGRLSAQSLKARYRDSNAVLVGSLVGISVVVAAAALVIDGSAWDRTLALSLAVAAILRSRLFSRTQHMLPLRLAGLVIIAGIGMRWAIGQHDLMIWIPVIVVAAMAAGIGLASLPLSQITRARVKRVLNIVEFLVVVDLLVVLCGAMGIYDQLGGIF